MARFAAFISYAHRYKEWVAALQHHLELCLEHAGVEPYNVFLDQTDLVSGRSWVTQLQEGLEKSDQLILVATPEALASPRAADEYQSFQVRRRGWAHGLFHVVMLVDSPLPPFVEGIHRLDFTAHDDETYRAALRELVGALLGGDARQRPELPPGLEAPPPPSDVLPADARRRLVEWLAPQVERKITRLTVATALGVEPSVLQGHPTPELTASAALVAATGDDDRVQAGCRIVRALYDAFDEEDGELLADLHALQEDLERLRKTEGGLLGAWLQCVRRDHSNLVPFFEHADLELLGRVYVQLELRPEDRWLRGDAGTREDLQFSLGRHWTIRDLLALEHDKYDGVTHRWVVRGDPGAGKTTLLRHLAATLAAEKGRRLYRSLNPCRVSCAKATFCSNASNASSCAPAPRSRAWLPP